MSEAITILGCFRDTMSGLLCLSQFELEVLSSATERVLLASENKLIGLASFTSPRNHI